MKIGVFGDSFAEKGYINHPFPIIWYQYLAQEGHDIECWGQGGSSIYFSAHQIQQKYRDYDLVIWCVTTPGRISFKHNHNWHHVTTSQDQYNGSDIEINKKHQVCVDYLKWMFDWEAENFIERCVVNQVSEECANVLLIPCFPPPLQAKFNLYTLAEREAQHWFPNQTIPEIYQKYQDLRAGHISKDNQKVLASLINKQLQPGLFIADYNDFIIPTLEQNQVFQKL